MYRDRKDPGMGALVASDHHEYTDALPVYLQIVLITGKCDISKCENDFHVRQLKRV